VRASAALLVAARDRRLWLPFVALAAFKAALLVGLARLDLISPLVLAPLLWIVPGAVRHLHYPDLVFRLPEVDRAVDLALFLTAGVVAQGWAIVHLSRAWTGEATSLLPSPKRGAARLLSLAALAALLVGIPLLVLHAMRALGEKDLAPLATLAVGIVLQVLLFAAPAFRVLEDVSLGRSIVRSVRLLGDLPLALPAAVLLLGALHLPGLLLRSPAISAGAARNPDWILNALLAQIPADLCGAVVAAGLATHFVLGTVVVPSRAARVAPGQGSR
jgi:hypothetical protein